MTLYLQLNFTLTNEMVGAAGFEPTITGSKPDALPLGYAPNDVSYIERAFYPFIFVKAMRYYVISQLNRLYAQTLPSTADYYRLSTNILSFSEQLVCSRG